MPKFEWRGRSLPAKTGLKPQLRPERHPHVVPHSAIEVHFVSSIEAHSQRAFESFHSEAWIECYPGIPRSYAAQSSLESSRRILI